MYTCICIYKYTYTYTFKYVYVYIYTCICTMCVCALYEVFRDQVAPKHIASLAPACPVCAPS